MSVKFCGVNLISDNFEKLIKYTTTVQNGGRFLNFIHDDIMFAQLLFSKTLDNGIQIQSLTRRSIRGSDMDEGMRLRLTCNFLKILNSKGSFCRY
jgi:hypothetical protein